MKNIYSNIYKSNLHNLKKAKKILENDKVIGFPTETVYGLAGNAYSDQAIKKIYKLKGRPKKNPLIIHFDSFRDAENHVHLNKNFFKLYKEFCPGPITFIVKRKKNSKISNLATSNLKTIAIRFPNNLKIKKILKKIKFPLAMPSANKSKSISPVTANDVYDEFHDKIKLIIDGGNCKIGIESTVVDITKGIKILRPGIISENEISKILKKKVYFKKIHKKISSPGLLKLHYSPGIPVKLNKNNAGKNVAFITLGKKYNENFNTFNLSKKSNLKEAAKNLYKMFRIIKNKRFKKIHVVKIPNKGIGVAINDRLKHAANKR